MRVATFNIKSAVRAMRWFKVVHDLQVAKRTEARILFWQELTKRRRHRRALRTVFPEVEGWKHFHASRKLRTSVTVDTDAYQVLRAQAHQLAPYDPLAGQPKRYANELVVRSRSLDRVDTAVFSVHLTNGGYNGRDRGDWLEQRRRRLWDKQWATLVELVAMRHAEGLDVVIGGDFNRVDLPWLHPAARVLVAHRIDKIIAVPAGGAVIEARRKVVVEDSSLYTDHPGLAVTVLRTL